MHQQVPAGSPDTPAALKLAAMSVPPEKLFSMSHSIRQESKLSTADDEAPVCRCASKSRSQRTRYCIVPRSGTTSVLLAPGQIDSTSALRVGDGVAVLEVLVGDAIEPDGEIEVDVGLLAPEDASADVPY